ncbi:hypothetical protein T4B_14191 [Trichinella pseudospiralis]|uniref:Uncharacterized protein n=1 Tax=Trichinella pseudospiralis TaxID=6337 RepID=A0A0V1KGK8_TRIPS|nr:hypothetical protein T4A_2625 [Trichinella pseudospiralis]KRZ32865.1 hypothetical protein T4B_14191 [Trichinella pseudospiralis]KRZ46365.1 hypothetical protein T4C_11212 [Trichinella pseudospiralis]
MKPHQTDTEIDHLSARTVLAITSSQISSSVNIATRLDKKILNKMIAAKKSLYLLPFDCAVDIISR